MSLKGSQRRDQRRRLVVSWKRAATADAAVDANEPRPMAQYAAEADPNRQRGPATLLPTGLGGLLLAATAILVPLAAILAVGGCEPILGRPLFVPGGRFARTIQVAAACFDPRSMQSLAGWLAQTFLLAAAAVAMIVRLMRRHRQDDYHGRYRAWGWLAGLFLITAAAAAVPLGPLVGAAVSDASGIRLGPGGTGWWIVLATVAYAAVSLWTVLPLHERGATAFWMVLTLGAWAGAAGCGWLAAGRDTLVVAGQAAWSLGAAFAAIAMLAAARSVIREIRGQCRPATAAPDRGKRPTAQPPQETKSEERSTRHDDATDDEPAADVYDEAEGEAFVDGSEQEQEQRHLSKAERKRLKKLARMNRAAA